MLSQVLSRRAARVRVRRARLKHRRRRRPCRPSRRGSRGLGVRCHGAPRLGNPPPPRAERHPRGTRLALDVPVELRLVERCRESTRRAIGSRGPGRVRGPATSRRESLEGSPRRRRGVVAPRSVRASRAPRVGPRRSARRRVREPCVSIGLRGREEVSCRSDYVFLEKKVQKEFPLSSASAISSRTGRASEIGWPSFES